MIESGPRVPWGRAGPSWSRTQGAGFAGGKGKPEDADPAQVLRVIHGAWGLDSIIWSVLAQLCCSDLENFDGHLVTSESFSPTNTAPCLRTSTITSRPSRNGSGTVPR